MSPKFYSYLWAVYLASAGVLWLAGLLSLVAVVVFGFIAFGMVFMGMMCVLPGAVSHPEPKIAKMLKLEKASKPTQTRPAKAVSGFSTYRSA